MESAGKVMATVFWDTRGIIHIDYLPSKQTINGDYYTALLVRFNTFKKKRSHLAKKKVLFHQNNARVHTCPAPMAKFNEFRYGFASPSSIFARFCPLRLFPVFKSEEMVRRIEIHHQRATHRKTEAYFEGVGQMILFGRLKKVGELLKYIELKGDYVEK